MRQDNLCAAHPKDLNMKMSLFFYLLINFKNLKSFHIMVSNVSYLYHSYHLFEEFFIFLINEAR